MTDFINQLNQQQQDAVLCTDGPVMIIAGAGSGKTRVLVYRIAHLIAEGHDPFRVLALTFTNKAAREMKNRITHLAGDSARNLWMGTFHSVFSRLLRVEAERLGYPTSFTIYDTDDSKNLIKQVVRDQGLDEKIYKPGLVYNRISNAKNNLISWQEYQNNPELVNDDKYAGKPHIGLLYELYQKRMYKSGAMDFDDLLVNTYVLLRDFPELLLKYQEKFKYILVDEFQDTNYAQYVIIRKLAARHQNICVVGDDAQSIYAFRGANIQNILSFEKDYPELRTFKLEQNYRSTKTIVNAANSIIEKNKEQLKKVIWTDNNNGEKIRLMKAFSDNEEGVMVANSIIEEKLTKQLHNRHFAILYRTNAQSRSMEEALRRKGIRYRLFGGISFYGRKEIKDMLAYFRLAVNPNDEEALKRVINYPKREIGATTMDKVIIAADKENLSLWNVLEQIESIPTGINGPTRNRISNFVNMIRSFGVMAKEKPAYDIASQIANGSGLLKELYNDDTPEAVSQYENIQELMNGIKEFTEKGTAPLSAPAVDEGNGEEVRLLSTFLQDIALITDAEQVDNDDDYVSLMTIHAAKGLEFPYVYIVGLEENLFPNQLSVQSREELEEERRLFYVATTRAEKQLTLSYATSRYRWGNLITCEPSRFIDEIAPEFINDLTYSAPVKHHKERLDNWTGFGNRRAAPPVTATRKAAPSPGPNFTKATKLKSPPAAAGFEGDDNSRIMVGMEVEHQKFGVGKVVHMEGDTGNRKATVFFPGLGNKQLLLNFAKLKIVG